MDDNEYEGLRNYIRGKKVSKENKFGVLRRIK